MTAEPDDIGRYVTLTILLVVGAVMFARALAWLLYVLSATQETTPMRLILLQRHAVQLAPYFDRVRAAAALGTPGMLVGQILFDAQRGQYYIDVGFLDHDKAKLITQAARAQIPGNTRKANDDSNPIL